MAKKSPSSEPFAKRWGARARKFGLEDLETDFIACGDSVLPMEAAPCLGFDDAESMPSLAEVFDPANSWPSKEKKRLEAYRVIGSDGAGNPICVETKSNEVWLLDHEDLFQTRQFMNTSVGQLAECLLAYMGEKDASNFQLAIKKIDAPAIGKGTFWHQEATCIGDDQD